MTRLAVIATTERDRERARAAAAMAGIEIAVVEAAADGETAVVIGDPATPVGSDVAYVARDTLDEHALAMLLLALATGEPIVDAPALTSPTSAHEAAQAKRVFEISRKLAGAADLVTTETIIVASLLELLDADRAHCLFFQRDDGSLWSQVQASGAGDDRRAHAGIAGWCAYTGKPAHARKASADPRWLAAIDDPGGEPDAQLLVQPVVGADRQTHAVLVAARRGRRPAFGDLDEFALARFAAQAAPLLDQLSAHVESQQLLDEHAGNMGHGAAASELYRKEALEAATAPPKRWGDVVRVSPGWIAWGYWGLVALLVAAAVFVSVGRVATYSTGPAVIRSLARTSLAVRTAGNIASVEVAAGDQVETGTVIARLDDTDQRAAVDRVTREFETQLRNHMLDPGDQAADASVRALRLELEQARTQLAEREIRAPRAGTISDLRVRAGQHVEPGEIAASLVDGRGGLEVVALLPGEDRPQLATGMRMRLELTGYRYAYQWLTIDSVSADVVAPGEARRVIGPDVAELPLGSSVVLVRGRLASSDFDVDGQTLEAHDGMLGTAEVRVRSERILFALVPGLRRFQ